MPLVRDRSSNLRRSYRNTLFFGVHAGSLEEGWLHFKAPRILKVPARFTFRKMLDNVLGRVLVAFTVACICYCAFN